MPPATLANPFDSDMVTQPDQQRIIDVPEVNRHAFEVCHRALEHVYRKHESSSVLFYGAAGSGKTHVLARLRHWLFVEPGGGSRYEPRPVFLGVRMETAPSHVWRYLRRRLAENLTQRSDESPALLEDVLRQIGAERFESAFESARLSLDFTRVLEHYHAGRHRALCRAWLKGEPMHPADLDRLGLSPQTGESLEDTGGEMDARQFVLALNALVEPRAIIYCFDQLEALALGLEGDYLAFGNLAASLMDETTNVLVISSIMASCLPKLENLPLSLFQRMSKNRADLQLLTWEQARRIVAARLDADPELAAYRRGGPVAPLNDHDLQRQFPPEGCTARKLIHTARELFERWRGGPAGPGLPVEEFLAQRFEKLRAASPVWKGPEETDEILRDGLQKLALVVPLGLKAAPGGKWEFTLGSGVGAPLLALCNQSNMTSLAVRLRRLAESVPAGERSRLRLIRDPRLPISPTARTTRRRLEEFVEGGARLVYPAAETVAALDALRRLLNQANSGELSHQGETIAFDSVREWLAHNPVESVDGLMREFAEGSRAVPDGLLELVAEERIVTVAEAAARLGVEAARVLEDARTCPDQIAVLGGAPAILFHVVPAEAGSERDRA